MFWGKKAIITNKVIICLAFFFSFSCVPLGIKTSWSLNEAFRGAEFPCRSRKIKAAATGICGFSTGLRTLKGAQSTMSSKCRLREKTRTRASCSGRETKGASSNMGEGQHPSLCFKLASLRPLQTVYSGQISFSAPKSDRTLSCTLH